MRRRIFVLAVALVTPIASVAVANTAQAGTGNAWKFPASINAPWAFGDNESDFDTPEAAIGLCRLAPFTSVNAYAPTSDANVIVNDPVNNSGASNLGCQTAAERDRHRGRPGQSEAPRGRCQRLPRVLRLHRAE